jgi:hypothetical protein
MQKWKKGEKRVAPGLNSYVCRRLMIYSAKRGHTLLAQIKDSTPTMLNALILKKSCRGPLNQTLEAISALHLLCVSL